jgi:hypothetical protein
MKKAPEINSHQTEMTAEITLGAFSTAAPFMLMYFSSTRLGGLALAG